jgi:hypothetical protein
MCWSESSRGNGPSKVEAMFDYDLPDLPGEELSEPEPDSKVYESTIAHIEESYKNCKVTRNYKPIGRRSGVKRQVDVWLDAKIGDDQIS